MIKIACFHYHFRLEGAKYEKAKEWRVPVVNVHWLNDLVLGHLSALKLPVNHRYQQFHTEDPFQVEMYKVAHLMSKLEEDYISL